MAADLKIDIVGFFSGKKAFNDAAKATIGLNNQVKTLAKSYLGLFTVQQLGRRGFNAAKAFAADDKAAQTLSRSLNNLGLAYADPAVKTFIGDLEKQFGVLDDQLRPAFQRLLTTTGDVAKSQSLLRTSLDLAAASGSDVVSVAGDISKGYVGQTRALAKYGLGLTQAELKAMSFEEIQARITDLFGGQAQVSADSYSGSLDKISVAAANASEIIGKGLVDALGDAGGKGGLAGSLDGIVKLATVVSDLLVGIGRTVAAISPFFSGKNLLESVREYRKITAGFREEDKIGRRQFGGAAATKYQKEAAALAKKNALASEKQTKAIKEQTALQKAGTLFDLQQGQIIAALKGKITDEERKRLELQLAILTGNTSEASKLAGELAKAQGLSTQLAAYLADLPDAKNPFTAWKNYLDMIEAQARRIAGMTPVAPMSIAGNNTSGTFSPAVQEMISGGNVSARAGANGNVNVYVAGSVVSEADLVEAVSNGLLNRSLSGSPSAIGRLKGSFAG